MRRPVIVTTGSLAALATAPAFAHAQLPASAPVAPAQEGRAKLSVEGGLGTRRARYLVPGQTVTVVGSVAPFVEGQAVTVTLNRGSRVTTGKRVAIQRSARGGGRFLVRFRVKRRGTLRAVAVHAATPQQKSFSASSTRLIVARFAAGRGSRGTKVRLLQRGLRRMGFAVPVGGGYGAATARAVLAYRKTNNMKRTGRASSAVFSRVFRGRGRFRPRHPRAGRHVELDWSRQVLAFVSRGRAVAVYHASSGKSSTPTVFGRFRFYRKQPGTNSKGMVHSNYFIGGYAIHGYKSVPTYPASHGCVRVPIANAKAIDNRIRLGQTIFVYR
ncbi:MAG: L,D-transpeptidase family protein [Actinomycetota bacterium]|nr:L,D-transpeptidase family protein [Actinomycetota bacterium]